MLGNRGITFSFTCRGTVSKRQFKFVSCVEIKKKIGQVRTIWMGSEAVLAHALSPFICVDQHNKKFLLSTAVSLYTNNYKKASWCVKCVSDDNTPVSRKFLCFFRRKTCSFYTEKCFSTFIKAPHNAFFTPFIHLSPRLEICPSPLWQSFKRASLIFHFIFWCSYNCHESVFVFICMP